ncbi:PLD nuclease N-terminal domain-containing protein [Cellulomonas sp.]|uniref:PLD nuclease N-terminal domain-containing protein n=1 Tax=Cellulomonas sp. TaxID=40001 RepID=UPI001B2A19F8|nr:PLD nuclease N-terminal domain-containing protein [Cellulomonas sp.]MBO9553190.1 PLDc_N domain-containing protein [Cellulomonas sp.]
MIRLLPYLLEIGMLVYCLIDCAQTDSASVRNLPKITWVFLIVILPVVGGIAWLVAGRPEQRRTRNVPWPSTATAGFPEYERPRRSSPDDDPEFLAGMRRSDQKHEEMLKAWEAQLRERESRLADDKEPPADGR